jgi:N-acetylmannosamine-6-phosphate 2-epimerase / N-acetylmannosamine kinase
LRTLGEDGGVTHFLQALKGKLIVSCQADPGDAFYGHMQLYAQAAARGGAAGIRANGPADVRAIHEAVPIPIIGIQKRVQTDGRVLITPSFEDAQALVQAGAAAVALDCTRRGQASGALDRVRRIKAELGVPVLSDIATVDEAQEAAEAGADCVLSTLRGYTDDTAQAGSFDPQFIEQLARAVHVPVIAEGRIDSPQLARRAIRAGAFAVVVGSVITRPHLVTRAFAQGVDEEFAKVSGQIVILGIDMGGTNTKFGLVRSDGKLLWEETAPTPARAGRAGLLEHLSKVAQTGLERARRSLQEPAAIGLATAGWVNPHTGQVVYATDTLPGWTGAEIGRVIGDATGLTVYVENDANALAAGEAEFGAGRGLTDFLCITLGTGVGGGCYAGGRLNRGSHYFANALGHISIVPQGELCNCGKRGCLETYANAAALLRYGKGRYASADELIEAANENEPVALSAIRELADHLAIGCAILVHLLDPQALIVAGGLVQNNPLLVASLQEKLAERVTVWDQRQLRVMASELGYHAGVLGAAAVALVHG